MAIYPTSDEVGFNSIGSSNGSTATLYIKGAATSNILMFDPMHQGYHAQSKLNIYKNSESNWYLGGESLVNALDIKKGVLTLTNVEYQRGAGYTSAAINMDTLNIEDGGTLSGSGTINAKKLMFTKAVLLHRVRGVIQEAESMKLIEVLRMRKSRLLGYSKILYMGI